MPEVPSPAGTGTPRRSKRLLEAGNEGDEVGAGALITPDPRRSRRRVEKTGQTEKTASPRGSGNLRGKTTAEEELAAKLGELGVKEKPAVEENEEKANEEERSELEGKQSPGANQQLRRSARQERKRAALAEEEEPAAPPPPPPTPPPPAGADRSPGRYDAIIDAAKTVSSVGELATMAVRLFEASAEAADAVQMREDGLYGYIALPASTEIANANQFHRLHVATWGLPGYLREAKLDRAVQRDDDDGPIFRSEGPAKEYGGQFARPLECIRRGEYGKATRALGEIGQADLNNPKVEDNLRKLYPAGDACERATEDDLKDIQVESIADEAVTDFLKSRPRGKAGGESGWTYDLIKTVLVTTGKRGVRALANFLTLIASGRLILKNPGTLRPWLCLRGVALRKSTSDDTRVRPIGIPEVFHNMLAGILVRRNKPHIAAKSGVTQRGYAVPAGCEAAGIFAKLALAEQPDRVLAVCDGTNFYNSLKRRRVQTAVKEVSDLKGIMIPLLSFASEINYKNKRGEDIEITFTSGLNQGGATSAPAACMAVAGLTADVLAQHPSVVHTAIIDDNAVVGTATKALACMLQLAEAMESLAGATMSSREVWAPKGLSDQDKSAYGAAGYAVMTDGVVFAGTPIGTAEFMEAHVKKVADVAIVRLGQAVRMSKVDPSKPSLQAIFRWVRMSVVPKFNFLLRVVDPAITIPHAKRIDEAIVRCCLRLAGAEEDFNGISKDAAGVAKRARIVQLIHLPIARGGLGLASQVAAAHAAYVGCWAATIAGVVGSKEKGGLELPSPAEGDTPEYMSAYASSLEYLRSKGVLIPEALEVGKVLKNPIFGAQSVLSQGIAEQVRNTLDNALAELPKNKQESRVRQEADLAAKSREGGAWLSASPRLVGCSMSDYEFRLALRTRLGMEMPEVAAVKGVCSACAKEMDTLGQHAHVCSKLRDVRSANAATYQQQLRRELKRADAILTVLPGEPHLKEYMAEKAGQKAQGDPRADIIFILNNGQENGAHVLVDLVNCATSAMSRKQSSTAGGAAQHAERRKNKQYARVWEAKPGGPPTVVRGFAQESAGPLGKFARKLLMLCATHTAPRGLPGSDPVGQRYSRIIERYSVLAQKRCAAVQMHYINTCCKVGGQPDAPAPPNDDSGEGE
jgi:hypothetical protein